MARVIASMVFVVEGANAVSSFVMRSPMPANMVVLGLLLFTNAGGFRHGCVKLRHCLGGLRDLLGELCNRSFQLVDLSMERLDGLDLSLRVCSLVESPVSHQPLCSASSLDSSMSSTIRSLIVIFTFLKGSAETRIARADRTRLLILELCSLGYAGTRSWFGFYASTRR